MEHDTDVKQQTRTKSGDEMRYDQQTSIAIAQLLYDIADGKVEAEAMQAMEQPVAVSQPDGTYKLHHGVVEQPEKEDPFAALKAIIREEIAENNPALKRVPARLNRETDAEFQRVLGEMDILIENARTPSR